MAFTNWSNQENHIIVEDYFSMLIDELKGNKINKTHHRKSIIPSLNNRTNGSVEFKYQNISAVLAEMGLPYIEGYKPRFNIQKSTLTSIVDDYLRRNISIEALFQNFSDLTPQKNSIVDFSSWVVPPPDVKKEQKKTVFIRTPIKINYLQREQDNRDLGLRGEQLVFEYEKSMLSNLGKDSLADKIEWVSRDLGDGLGFDILSKNTNGSDKYVEVKTTKLSKETPFYFSSNEYNFSIQHGSNYHLYRVFDFKTSPKMFTLSGQFDSFCLMEPTQYSGKF